MSKMENTFAWNKGTTKNIAQLEQKVQQLERQLQAIEAQVPNFARFDQDNNWVPQTFSFPNANLSFIQDNNANFLLWKKSTNDRRGYVGMGRTGQDVIDLWGKDGTRIISLNNDLELIPAGNINCSNKPLTNLAAPVNPNDATTKEYVDNKTTISVIEGTWNSIVPRVVTWPNIAGGVSKVINLSTWLEKTGANDKMFSPNLNVRITNNGNDIEFEIQAFGSPPTGNWKIKAVLTYIRLT